MILTIIQAVTFISYITFLMVKFKGPLPSISDSWYRLGSPLGRLFSLFCFILGVTMFLQGGGIIWFVISGAGLSFVSAATAFKKPDTPTGTIHGVAAGIGIAFALLGIGLTAGYWIPLMGFIGVSVLLKLLKVKNFTWWVEIAAFTFILFGLIVTKL